MVEEIKFIDLFCGIGGFRYAMEDAAKEHNINTRCMLSSDIDKECQEVYFKNFGERPLGDISKIDVRDIPDHDILLAGFPCQPFSIIGQMKGFEDTRGTLFFEIARIIAEKRPKFFVLENVKLLVGHDKGRTMSTILKTLRDLDYYVNYKVFNALDFGLPQKRERVFIVGFNDKVSFRWPECKEEMIPLDQILDKNVDGKFYVSEEIRLKRLEKHVKTKETTIWHENKAGNISAYPYSCALRAGASYNYLLVNGERRLTGREMLRLQGFPERHEIISSYTQTRKQAGNSLPIPVAKSVISNLLKSFEQKLNYEYASIDEQYILLEDEENYDRTSETTKCREVRTTLSA